eukprot:6487632-Amphidinium_carterae.2
MGKRYGTCTSELHLRLASRAGCVPLMLGSLTGPQIASPYTLRCPCRSRVASLLSIWYGETPTCTSWDHEGLGSGQEAVARRAGQSVGAHGAVCAAAAAPHPHPRSAASNCSATSSHCLGIQVDSAIK